VSKDIAQRAVVIQLARPEYGEGWDRAVRAHIEDHRWEILRDIGAFLEGPAKAGYRARTRWAAWEDGVLARVATPINGELPDNKLTLTRDFGFVPSEVCQTG
jgi:hypothetical protein